MIKRLIVLIEEGEIIVINLKTFFFWFVACNLLYKN